MQNLVQLVCFKFLYELPDDDSFGIETCSIVEWHPLYRVEFEVLYLGADKPLARPGRKQATGTEDFDFHISNLLSLLEEY